MPQIDFDGANSAVKTDKIQGQSGTTVTVPTGHTVAITDADRLTIAGTAVKAGALGKVLQCLHTEFTGYTSVSSSTYIDTQITANITPASTSSRIVTIVEFTVSSNSTGNSAVGYQMLRGSTIIHSVGSHGGIKVYGHTTNTREVASVTGIHVDSPNSTSAQTYKMQASSVDSATIYINAWGLGSASTTPSYITLIELSS